jgi:hypothetical protein
MAWCEPLPTGHGQYVPMEQRSHRPAVLTPLLPPHTTRPMPAVTPASKGRSSSRLRRLWDAPQAAR